MFASLNCSLLSEFITSLSLHGQFFHDLILPKRDVRGVWAMKLRSRYRFVLVILLSFGLLAAVAPLWMKRWVEAITENPSLDTIHAVSQGLGFLPTPHIPVTLVRIDDESFGHWHRPFPFSKAIIAGLVRAARDAKPAAILVDLDISAATTQDDAKLLTELLSNWQSGDPPLLFPRELAPNGSAFPTVFDQYFVPGKPLYWVSVLFEERDGAKIRNGNLWEVPTGTCHALLSPQLFSYAHEKGGITMVEYAQDYLARGAPGCLGRAAVAPDDAPDWLKTADKSAPIQFSFPKSEMAMSRMTIRGSSDPALIQLSAYQFAQRPVASSALANRFVIIGNSYAANGDSHDTPIGEMEGMRVIANAVANANNALEAKSWRIVAGVTVYSMLLGGIVAFLTAALKALVSGPLALLVGIVIYTVCNVHLGSTAAQSVVRNAIVIWVLVTALQSLESICRGIIVERRSWRSFLNG